MFIRKLYYLFKNILYIMNPIHFFTLGYYQEYLFIGIIFGIIIGVYVYFRVKYILTKVIYPNRYMIETYQLKEA